MIDSCVLGPWLQHLRDVKLFKQKDLGVGKSFTLSQLDKTYCKGITMDNGKHLQSSGQIHVFIHLLIVYCV
jgi:hypothetical protein